MVTAEWRRSSVQKVGKAILEKDSLSLSLFPWLSSADAMGRYSAWNPEASLNGDESQQYTVFGKKEKKAGWRNTT